MRELSDRANLPVRMIFVGRWLALSIVATALIATGCGARRPTAASIPRPSTARPLPGPNPAYVPGVYTEEGTASWYGVPFHGRRAADGEIFDMYTLVAAHRTLPFGSVIRVTNLRNGLHVDVRVIDRGPFVEGRILDLAQAAAAKIDMVGTGTAPVRIQLLSGPTAPTTDEFTVQVAAFTNRDNAAGLRERLLSRYQPIFIQDYDAPQAHFYRVRVGRAPSTEAAQKLAAQLRSSDHFQTFVVRLDLPAGAAAK
jgi:rare lipoprotein A